MGLELQLPQLGGQADRVGGDRADKASCARRQPDLPGVPSVVLPSARPRRSCSSQLTWFTASTFRVQLQPLCPARRHEQLRLHSGPYRRLRRPLARSTAVLSRRDAFQRTRRQAGRIPRLVERPVCFGARHDPSCGPASGLRRGPAHEHEAGPSGFLKWITSTDHKVIGKNYTVTAVIFFLLAGAMRC